MKSAKRKREKKLDKREREEERNTKIGKNSEG